MRYLVIAGYSGQVVEAIDRTPDNDRLEWERKVIDALAARLQISNSDAQGIFAVQLKQPDKNMVIKTCWNKKNNINPDLVASWVDNWSKS